jgi:multidrug efflux pump subunit AcrA (membrane-fusion protein)
MTIPKIGRGLLSGLLTLTVVALVACDGGEDAAPEAAAGAPPPAVVVTPVIEQEVAETAEFVGRTAAY